MKALILSTLALSAFCANASDIINATFANGMPKDFTTIDADGAEMKPNIYRNTTDYVGGWFVGNIGGSHGRAALSPTRNDDDIAAEHWMILPAFKVEDEDVRITWESRSMHKHLKDDYKVMVRVSGSDTWTEELSVTSESHSWTYRSICIEQYIGQEIEVAFVANSTNGFILAIDNVNVFHLNEHAPALTAKAINPKFFGENDEVDLQLCVNNTGNTVVLTSIEVWQGENMLAQISDPLMWHGLLEERVYTIPISAPLNEKCEYTVVATSESGENIILLDSDWVYRSHYPRTSVIDRGSGTWCNNCPPMELTVTRLEDIYGSQIIPLETHVNDLLSNSVYTSEYIGTFIRSIPTLVPNHEKENITNSLASADDFSSKLIQPTIASVKAEYSVADDGSLDITAHTEFAFDTDNSDGRYKLGYMLVANMYDSTYGGFLQRNSASSYRQEQFYYMPTSIMPEMMIFDNVPVNCVYATNGLDGSLPSSISARETLLNSVSLSPDMTGSALPETALTSVTPIVMIIDTSTGAYLNATIAVKKSDSGAVSDITADSNQMSEDQSWYTLQGMRLGSKPTAPGIYIHNKKIVKL